MVRVMVDSDDGNRGIFPRKGRRLPPLSFEVSRQAGEPATGFDLGDIRVTGDQFCISSAGQRPNQSMMIYLSLSALLDGLSHFSKARSGSYSFYAIDSSFRLDFILTRAGLMKIKGRGDTLIAEVSPATCLASVRAGVDRFLADPENQLPPSDPAAGDLRASRQAFEAAANSAGR
jgi:hypothetical protein